MIKQQKQNKHTYLRFL